MRISQVFRWLAISGYQNQRVLIADIVAVSDNQTRRPFITLTAAFSET